MSININPLSAGKWLVLDFWLLESKVLHKEGWVAVLLGTLIGVQDYQRSNVHDGYIRNWQLKGEEGLDI